MFMYDELDELIETASPLELLAFLIAFDACEGDTDTAITAVDCFLNGDNDVN